MSVTSNMLNNSLTLEWASFLFAFQRSDGSVAKSMFSQILVGQYEQILGSQAHAKDLTGMNTKVRMIVYVKKTIRVYLLKTPSMFIKLLQKEESVNRSNGRVYRHCSSSNTCYENFIRRKVTMTGIFCYYTTHYIIV